MNAPAACRAASPAACAAPSNRAGYTIANLMVALGIFSFVMAGILSSHIFGLKLMALSQVRMSATDGLDFSLQGMVDNLRSAQQVYVGNWTSQGFARLGPGAPRQGNAVQIVPASAPAQALYYFVDPADQRLKSIDSASTQTNVIFESVSNSNVFSSLDISGNVLTNQRPYKTVGIDIVFSALDHAQVRLGAGQVYSSYEIRTQVARRNLD